MVEGTDVHNAGYGQKHFDAGDNDVISNNLVFPIQAMSTYEQTAREKWLFNYPGQVIEQLVGKGFDNFTGVSGWNTDLVDFRGAFSIQGC